MNFAIKSQDTRIEEMKNLHELTRKAIDEVSWIMYWNKMTREGIWADQKFIQCSAWFLEMNIGIVDVAGNLANPYYIIDCGKDEAETLWLGLKTDVHYQSLLKDSGGDIDEDSNGMDIDDVLDDIEDVLEDQTKDGSGRIRMNQDGSGWIRMDQDGSGWIRMDQDRLGRIRMQLQILMFPWKTNQLKMTSTRIPRR